MRLSNTAFETILTRQPADYRDYDESSQLAAFYFGFVACSNIVYSEQLRLHRGNSRLAIQTSVMQRVKTKLEAMIGIMQSIRDASLEEIEEITECQQLLDEIERISRLRSPRPD